MRLAFGEHFTPAFVPPYHGYDKHTYGCFVRRVLRFFQPVTAGRSKTGDCIEMPAQISFSRYEQGQTSIHHARDVLAALARGIYRRPLSG